MDTLQATLPDASALAASAVKAPPHGIRNATVLAYTQKGQLVLKKPTALALFSPSDFERYALQQRHSPVEGVEISEGLMPHAPKLTLELADATPNDFLLLLHRRRGQRETDDEPLQVQNLESMRANGVDAGDDWFPLALAIPRNEHPQFHLVLHFDRVRLQLTDARYTQCTVAKLRFDAEVRQDPFAEPSRFLAYAGRVYSLATAELDEQLPALL